MSADETEPSLTPSKSSQVITMWVGGWVENETMGNQRMLVFRKLVNQLGQIFVPNKKMDGSDNDWTLIIQRGVQRCRRSSLQGLVQRRRNATLSRTTNGLFCHPIAHATRRQLDSVSTPGGTVIEPLPRSVTSSDHFVSRLWGTTNALHTPLLVPTEATIIVGPKPAFVRKRP